MNADAIRLTAGSLSLELDPAFGGSISSFTWDDGTRQAEVMRTTDGADPTILGTACFPLVPYVNRIRDGRFTFRGTEVRLAANLPGDPSPLHGQGWLAPWTVEQFSERRALLRFDSPAGEWPWAYSAEQRFELDAAGLSLEISCRNQSDQPMPCGLGIHPYFVCGPATRLDTQVETCWTIDDKVLPVEQVPADGPFDLKDRLICGQGLDHGFGGWGGKARISDPSWPVTVEFSSPTARFFQVYSPPEGRFFAAEPVTHANAALNEPESEWDALGLRIVEPGEEMRLAVRFDVTPV
jgi:aldose 1-epimerase